MGLKTKTAPASSGAALQRYESSIVPSRSRVTADPITTYVLTFDDPVLRQLFLIYFCALGVAMTEPVEDWIRRAGQRCEELGLSELGRFLKAHAKHEAGHHLMMIEDTRALVAHWNATRTPSLDADKILSLPLTPGVLMYRKLHEDTIAGDAPFGQIAIEYEIEKLSVQFGPPLIQKCVAILGPGIMLSLSFIKEHMEIDVAHTRFNEEQLGKLLASRPEFLTALVQAGEKALMAYKGFIEDALHLATVAAEVESEPLAKRATPVLREQSETESLREDLLRSLLTDGALKEIVQNEFATTLAQGEEKKKILSSDEQPQPTREIRVQKKEKERKR